MDACLPPFLHTYSPLFAIPTMVWIGLSSHVEAETRCDDRRHVCLPAYRVTDRYVVSSTGSIACDMWISRCRVVYTGVKQLRCVLHFTISLRFTDTSFFSYWAASRVCFLGKPLDETCVFSGLSQPLVPGWQGCVVTEGINGQSFRFSTGDERS